MLSPIQISPFASRIVSNGVAPVNTVAPALIYTTLDINDVITCDDGTWTGTSPITYTYQWYRDETPIGGGTANSHTIVFSDIGTTLKCVVTGTNAVGNSSVDSDTVAVIWTFKSIHINFASHNTWTSKNSTDAGTVSTWLDYDGTHDLANPAAGNQPTVVNPDSDFNNLKTYSFATDDYLIKNTPNYGAGQTTGSLWMVFKTSALGVNNSIFSVCDVSTNLSRFQIFIITTNKIRLIVATGATTFALDVDTAVTANTKYIVEFESNGSTVSVYVNGVLAATTVNTGVNTGQWLDNANTLSDLDNVSIGAKINTLPIYFNGKIVSVSNTPLLSDANRTLMFNALNEITNTY